MTDLYAPYEAPKLQSMGWRVGPIEHPTISASGDCAGLDAEIGVDATIPMNVGVASGAALDSIMGYTPVYNTTALPAASNGAGSSAGPSLSLTKTMDLADGSGGTALIPTAALTYPSPSDNFNRADSTTSLGSNWTARANVLGVLSNGAYGYGSGINSATHNSPATSDDVTVSITLGALTGGSPYEWLGMIFGADSAGGSMATALYYYDGAGGAAQASLYRNGTWTTNGTNVAGGYVTRMTTGDVFSVNRTGNAYTLKINGTTTSGGTWTDSSNYVTRDSSHRLVGLWVDNAGSGYYRLIDSITTT